MEKAPKEISRYFNKHIIFPTYQCYQITSVQVNPTYRGNYWASAELISKYNL